MPDASTISPYVVRLGGGLVLDRDTFSIPPGAATQLQNFEPDIAGGYRRINGFSKYNSNIVPQTSSATEKILGVVLYKDQVIAARGEKVYKGTTSGSWTQIDSGRTNAGRFDFVVFNHDGTDKVVWCDGQNAASVYNNTTVTDITTSPAPSNPSNCAMFKAHLFLSGASANPSEVFFSAPFAETDFTTASGGGSFRTESAVLKLKVFRDRLFIFCKEEIYQLIGNSASDFKLQPVTKDIGCLSGFSVQEIGGDLVYLAPDGLRTIAGTERIDDIELGTVSKQVQPRLDNASLDRISSLVIRNKSQYRLFFPEDSQTVSNAAGLIGVIKANPEGQVGWEYADLKGLKPACCASGFVSNVETQIHGGYDGYVHRHDSGNNFDGTNIKAIYLSPDHTMGDPGIRKMMQRIILSYDNEAAVNSSFRIRYDFGASDVPQPAQYVLTTGSSIAIYSNTASTYGTAVYGSSGSPLVRQTVEGGGFTIAVRLDDNNGAAPISLKGYQLEFTPGGRR
jgi:hypothetical protein